MEASHPRKYCLYTWGKGAGGQLGLGHYREQKTPALVEVLADLNIERVAFGTKHSLAQSRGGDVYAWGWNWYAQLGVGDREDKCQPTLLKNMALAKAYNGLQVTSLGAGSYHSLACTSDGDVYIWGSNEEGQAATGSVSDIPTAIPQLLPLSPLLKVKEVHCGAAHSILLIENGDLYAWGRNDHGQCGVGRGSRGFIEGVFDFASDDNPSLSHLVLLPSLVQLPNNVRVKSLSCGQHHTLCVSDTGVVYAWGTMQDGVLGLGFPREQKGDIVKQWLPVEIVAGYYHSAAIDVDGLGECGQLGHGDYVSKFLPQIVDFTLNTTFLSSPLPNRNSACDEDNTMTNNNNDITENYGNNSTTMENCCDNDTTTISSSVPSASVLPSPMSKSLSSSSFDNLLFNRRGEYISRPPLSFQLMENYSGKESKDTTPCFPLSGSTNEATAYTATTTPNTITNADTSSSTTDTTTSSNSNIYSTPINQTLEQEFDKIKIVDVSCGGRHSMALDSKGRCYVWGLASNGQLGLGLNLPHVSNMSYAFPQLLEFPYRVCNISSGQWCSAAVCVVENEKDEGMVEVKEEHEKTLNMNENGKTGGNGNGSGNVGATIGLNEWDNVGSPFPDIARSTSVSIEEKVKVDEELQDILSRIGTPASLSYRDSYIPPPATTLGLDMGLSDIAESDVKDVGIGNISTVEESISESCSSSCSSSSTTTTTTTTTTTIARSTGITSSSLDNLNPNTDANDNDPSAPRPRRRSRSSHSIFSQTRYQPSLITSPLWKPLRNTIQIHSHPLLEENANDTFDNGSINASYSNGTNANGNNNITSTNHIDTNSSGNMFYNNWPHKRVLNTSSRVPYNQFRSSSIDIPRTGQKLDDITSKASDRSTSRNDNRDTSDTSSINDSNDNASDNTSTSSRPLVRTRSSTLPSRPRRNSVVAMVGNFFSDLLPRSRDRGSRGSRGSRGNSRGRGGVGDEGKQSDRGGGRSRRISEWSSVARERDDSKSSKVYGGYRGGGNRRRRESSLKLHPTSLHPHTSRSNNLRNHPLHGTNKLLREWEEEILPNWDTAKHSLRVRQLWSLGIPNTIRGRVWAKALCGEVCYSRNLYSVYKRHAQEARLVTEHVDSNNSPAFRLIAVDVPRTFYHTHLFVPGGAYYTALTELLECFVVSRPDIGYIQGMSYLGGMLLLFTDQITAFSCFSNLFNNHFFVSLCRMDLEQIYRHLRVFDILFEYNLPDLYHHFKMLAVTSEQYLLDWFLTLFSRALPIPVACRVWDIYLLEGEVVLYRIALAILRIKRIQLLAAEFEECVTGLRRIAEEIEEKPIFEALRHILVPPYVAEYIAHLALLSSK